MNNKLNQEIINICENLNINFMLFKDKVNWPYISQYQKLSEDFIREFKDKVNWPYISQYQKLSEDFIREFKDKVNWHNISIYQKLSEDFIREFKDKVNWSHICEYQKLSENFIREFKDKVNWNYISIYQKLSEDFIREFKDEVNWFYISLYQKLSEDFIREFNLQRPINNWLYVTKEDKLQYIKKNAEYEVINDEYIIAYKSVRLDNYSVYNRQYKYEVERTYESHCDCNLNHSDSFGLSAWTKEGALNYYNKGKLLKVRINIDDIGAIVHNDSNKVRCFKLTVLEIVS